MEAPNRNRVTAAALKYTMVSLKRIGRGVYCYNQLVVVRGWKKGEERMDLLVWLVACFALLLLFFSVIVCWICVLAKRYVQFRDGYRAVVSFCFFFFFTSSMSQFFPETRSDRQMRSSTQHHVVVCHRTVQVRSSFVYATMFQNSFEPIKLLNKDDT